MMIAQGASVTVAEHLERSIGGMPVKNETT